MFRGDRTLATPEHRRLATWFLAQEVSLEGGVTSTVEATGRAWGRLSRRLAQIFATSGSEALGKRAVYLAQDDFPFLKGPNGPIPLESLPAALEGKDEEQAVAAAESVYANLVDLLITFIGEDLALRAIRDVWPGASLDEPGTNAQEAQP